MNYRVLFIISFLILGIGFVGLFWEPTVEQPVQQQAKSEPKVEKTHNVVITTATALKDLKVGQLLSADDYLMKDVTIKVLDSAKEAPALENYNLNVLFTDQDNKEKTKHSLQGFLVKENISKDSLINPNALLTPNSPDFLLSSLDAKNEVAYVLPIHIKDDFVLKTLKAGEYVSVYSKQSGQGRDNQNKNTLVKILDHILVLRISSVSEKQKEEKNNTTAGNVVLKLSLENTKKLYNLPKGVGLMLLPSEKPEETNSRGNLIRNLRG